MYEKVRGPFERETKKASLQRLSPPIMKPKMFERRNLNARM